MDFSRARRGAHLGRMTARLLGYRNRPLAFDEVRKWLRADKRLCLGGRVVEVSRVVGSVGRWRQFDRCFMPAEASTEDRWKRVDLAFRRGEELPMVSLYKIGEAYFVLDGNHRVSVARYQGVEWIDAVVTEFRPCGGGVWQGGQPSGVRGLGAYFAAGGRAVERITVSAEQIVELRAEGEFREAFAAIRELHHELNEKKYMGLLAEMRPNGYRLFVIRDSGGVVGVVGTQVLTNLYYELHVYAYDLITKASTRSKGYGQALLAHVEDVAR